MKANIKGEWVDYNYSIHNTRIDQVLLELQNNGITAEYLGKSKAIMIDGEVTHLKTRMLFFKFL